MAFYKTLEYLDYGFLNMNVIKVIVLIINEVKGGNNIMNISKKIVREAML